MKISDAFGFPFRGPNAWANMGCVLVCFLIPIIGPIVILGYSIRMELRLLESIDADAPKFDFGKFTNYLTRGVQPFLVSLVLALILVPVVWVLMAVGVVGMMVLVEKHPLLGILCLVSGLLGYLIFIVVFSVVTGPMGLKAGLEDRFGAAFDFGFIMDYLKRVGLLTLGLSLLLSLMLLPAMVVMCVPIIGPYLVIVPLLFINTHLRVQLYQEYLRRGGTPINIKAEFPESERAFPVVPSTPVAAPRMPPTPPLSQ